MNKFNFKLIIVSLVCTGLIFSLSLSTQAAEKININTASQQELETLNGIGPSKAVAIIEYREQNGPFNSIEEIMQVPGIGPATFEKIKDSIIVKEINDDQAAEVVINELLPNPTGGDEAEWIELKNIGQQAVDLTGWKIRDLKKEYVIQTEDFDSTVVPAGGFLLIQREISGLVLNNSGGEELKLFDSENKLISQTSYTQTAEEGVSWARDDEGNYSWTVEITPGAENIIQPVDELNKDEAEQSGMAVGSAENYSVYRDVILLNELWPNPPGIDDGEWIELYNNSDRAINLEGWKLKTTRSEFKINYKIIKPRGYVVFNREVTGLRLKNIRREELRLIDRLGWQVAKVTYDQAVEEGKSYNWCPQTNEWLWLDEASPGQANKCPLKNELPVAYFELSSQQANENKIISLDAGESYDADGQIVSYKWEFEYPVEALGKKGKLFEFKNSRLWVKLLSSQRQTIKLSVKDDLGGEASYEVKLNGQQIKLNGKVYLNRLLPNPAGADKDNEWIEICSQTDRLLSLHGVCLDDNREGSKAYKLDNYSLEPLACVKIFNSQSGLILNNQADEVRLLAGDEIIDEVSYQQAPEDYIYVRQGDGEWEWLLETGQQNYGQLNGWPSTQEFYTPLNNLAQTNNLAIGSWVKVVGQVTVEPGLLGANIFYIADDSGGLQIYSYKKTFPLLAIGDKVEVQGELVEYQGGIRVKVSQQKDIVNLGRDRDLIQPIFMSIDEIDDNLVGSLVEIEGELVEIKSSAWWLDDKSGEIKIYLKRNTQINKDNFKLGDKIEVRGIVDKYGGELRLLPRWADDVRLAGRVEGISQSNSYVESINNYRPGGASGEWLKYITAILMAGVIILISIIFKLRDKIKK